MGQRHQIYALLPSGEVIGWHHQWLYGFAAMVPALQTLKFARNGFGKRNYPFGPKASSEVAHNALRALYSHHVEFGINTNLSDLHFWAKFDPDCGDNNNGITVFDLSQPKPAYAYCDIGGLECLHENVDDEKDYEPYVPMDAQKWASLHWEDPKDYPDSEVLIATINEMLEYPTISQERLGQIFPVHFGHELNAPAPLLQRGVDLCVETYSLFPYEDQTSADPGWYIKTLQKIINIEDRKELDAIGIIDNLYDCLEQLEFQKGKKALARKLVKDVDSLRVDLIKFVDAYRKEMAA